MVRKSSKSKELSDRSEYYQAKQIFESLKEDGEEEEDKNFVACNRRFNRLKTRYNLTVRCGNFRLRELCFSFPETLKTMIEEGDYNSKTIFNVNEAGLSWKEDT
ncbi:hypothetical protein CDAR_21391 [Caerostris darwini]|uniref:Uncharacterized protein n=1 Tax=Caerostris darwini TaxID=1538125 RepID=A0AAV4VZ98_9ARAC|nr:hypothetical protein CDAR_21391 [Caerostris darwini]